MFNTCTASSMRIVVLYTAHGPNIPAPKSVELKPEGENKK